MLVPLSHYGAVAEKAMQKTGPGEILERRANDHAVWKQKRDLPLLGQVLRDKRTHK